jgi:hypothetical protein
MKDELIEEVIKSLNVSDNGKCIKINDNPIEVKKENFNSIKEFDVNNKIVFIDGGNVELLKAPNFSLQLIRVYYTVYLENKRIKNERKEFYLLINSVEKDDSLFFKTKIFGDHENLKDFQDAGNRKTISQHNIIEDFEINSFDKTITQGINRGDISFIGNIARRFAELNLAKKFEDEIIVLDGSLEAKYDGEEKLLEELNEKSIIGLSKTCELFTDKGSSALNLLRSFEQEKEWYYHVGKVNEKYDLLFAKLNEKSNYIFRIDVFDMSKIDKILSLLKSNSKDPVFLGYPYGLIEADKFARISNKELELLKTRFMIKAGKNWEKINEFLKAKDSHNILDNIA